MKRKEENMYEIKNYELKNEQQKRSKVMKLSNNLFDINIRYENGILR
jgi:hypothetical protein